MLTAQKEYLGSKVFGFAGHWHVTLVRNTFLCQRLQRLQKDAMPTHQTQVARVGQQIELQHARYAKRIARRELDELNALRPKTTISGVLRSLWSRARLFESEHGSTPWQIKP